MEYVIGVEQLKELENTTIEDLEIDLYFLVFISK